MVTTLVSESKVLLAFMRASVSLMVIRLGFVTCN